MKNLIRMELLMVWKLLWPVILLCGAVWLLTPFSGPLILVSSFLSPGLFLLVPVMMLTFFAAVTAFNDDGWLLMCRTLPVPRRHLVYAKYAVVAIQTGAAAAMLLAGTLYARMFSDSAPAHLWMLLAALALLTDSLLLPIMLAERTSLCIVPIALIWLAFFLLGSRGILPGLTQRPLLLALLLLTGVLAYLLSMVWTGRRFERVPPEP